MSIAESIKRHPVRAAFASAAVFIFVTFPVWLAQVWPLFSERPFVVVVVEKGWGWLVITPLYGWVCVALGTALVANALYVALGNRQPRNRPLDYDPKREKVFTSWQSKDFFDLFEKTTAERRTAFAPHVGLWTRIESTVDDIDVRDDGWVVLSVDLSGHRPGKFNLDLPMLVRLFFTGSDAAVARTKRVGDPVRAVGRIHEDFHWASGLALVPSEFVLDDKPQLIADRTESVPNRLLAQREPVDATLTSSTSNLNEPGQIPEGEFEVSLVRKGKALLVKVDNHKREPKNGYVLRVMDMFWYSEKLEGGRGGFVRSAWFEELKGVKNLHGNSGSGKPLRHGTPEHFELLRDPGKEPWSFVLAGSALALTQSTSWRIELQLVWINRSWPMLAEIELKQEANDRFAECALHQGVAAIQLLASTRGEASQ